MKIYTIYLAINKNDGNKPYIGKDAKWPSRKNHHKKEAYDKNNPNHDCYFHRAIRKHGWQSFEWLPIYQTTDKKHITEVMETYFIKEYNSHYKTGFGYNMTYGGEGIFGYKMPLYIRKKLSKSHKGKIFTKEHKEKLRLSHLGKIPPNKGIKHSEETKKKMRLAWKKRKNKQPFLGHKHTKETKEKLSQITKQQWVQFEFNG